MRIESSVYCNPLYGNDIVGWQFDEIGLAEIQREKLEDAREIVAAHERGDAYLYIHRSGDGYRTELGYPINEDTVAQAMRTIAEAASI